MLNFRVLEEYRDRSQPDAGKSSEGDISRKDKRHAVIIVENMAVPADRRVWQEATTLAANGWRVSVICPQADGYTAARETLEGVEIYRHPRPFEANGMAGYILEYGLALMFELWLLCRIGLGRIDVVQICNPPDFLFLPAMIAKWFGAKLVFDHHDLTPELLLEKRAGRREFLYHFTCWAERQTFARADRVISTNRTFAEIATNRGGVDPDNVAVVYSAPDLSRVSQMPTDPALRHGKGTLLLWVGMIGSQDGVDLLLQAISILRNDLGEEDFHLQIVGDGPERDALIAMRDELGIADAVSFPGFQTGDALKTLFSSADIGIGSDPKNDFNDKLAMNKVMEYMAYGLPTVMFDLTECRHIAGDSALVAENNDPADLARQIQTLMNHPERAKQMGDLGAERLRKHFAWSHQTAAYLESFDVLVSA